MDDRKILSKTEIEQKLSDLPGWEYQDNKIFKPYQFASFSQGIGLINKLTPFFNDIDHHPDMHIYYKKILFELSRYDVGGKVTERDFTVAHKIEDEFNRLEGDEVT